MFKLPIALAFLAFTVLLGSVESCDYADEPCVLIFTREMQDQIVDYHNELRRNATPRVTSMEKMYWDDIMAEFASMNAGTFEFEHSPMAELRFKGYTNFGQNLFESSEKPSVVAPVIAWYSEKEFFTYGEKDASHTVRNYKQVMRDKSARIGCGSAYCPNRDNKYIVTCIYLKGQFKYTDPYDSGDTCSACPNRCRDKLCDCGGKVCQNGGTLDLNTCRCTCPTRARGGTYEHVA